MRSIPVVGPALSAARRSIHAGIDRRRFSTSADYWQQRYADSGTSGEGSRGVLADYKAGFLNRFVAEHDIASVIEFGCGDGFQLTLATYPSYVGLDVAPGAIELCSEKFAGDPTKSFLRYDPQHWVNRGAVTAELALSLDVIFHLVEDDVFHRHIEHLFAAATRFVIIYSSDEDDDIAAHVRSRQFTPHVTATQPSWRLAANPANPHADRSMSRFFVYERVAGAADAGR